MTGWVLLTVPAARAVLAMIVLTFPRLAATAWDSMGLRWDETMSYWSAGDLAGAATSAISLVLVALPVLSIVYLVSYWCGVWPGGPGERRPGVRAGAPWRCSASVASSRFSHGRGGPVPATA